jgi:N utilization substance protein B
MANRHISRSIVLQSLFEWDFKGKPDDLMSIVQSNIAEFAVENTDTSFVFLLSDLVARKCVVIDDIIVKAAPDWPLEKISNVDRNILRLGLAELLFGDREQVPPKVAINEAIELAKMFGGENSSRFVNGVLGAVYKEIGEPGKDQVGKQKKSKIKEPEEPVDPATLPKEEKGGGFVYCKDGDEYKIAMVHDVFGYWTLAKGGMEEGETIEETAKRELEEKLGIPVTLEDKIGTIEYVASHPEKKKILKIFHVYLARAEFAPLDLHSNGGLDNAQWFTLPEVVDLTTYDDIVPLIVKAVEIITKK